MRIQGEASGEFVGSRFAALANGDFVLGIRSRDGAVAEEGVVLLINGATGELITEIRGADVGATRFGNNIIALDNGNFVVGSSDSDSAGLNDNGFIGLFDGAGALLASVVGDNDGDEFGLNLVALENGRFLAANSNDDVDGLADAGSIIFFDSTGVELARLAGDVAGEAFGSDEVVLPLQLDNGNIVITTFNATVAGVPFAGRVTLVDGTDFTEISRLEFDNEFDLDQIDDIATLPNGNFVIVTPGDDVNGIEDAGSMRLVNGATGEILLELQGAVEFEFSSSQVASLASDHFVFANADEDFGGVVDSGVVRVIDASTGEIVRTFEGDQASDRFGSRVFALEAGGFLIGSPNNDFNGLGNAGSAVLVTAQ